MTTKKYLHAGHRGRMRNRFLREGLGSLADHEVLELLLFYALPRQDVNPMAHALLEKFGSLPDVLDAPVAELCTIRGIGPKVARFLTLIPDLLFQMEYCLLSPVHASLRSPADLTALMTRRASPPSPGDIYAIPLDARYATLAVYPYASFDELDVRELALLCLNFNSRRLVLAECIVDLSAFPLPHRSQVLLSLQEALAALDIQLADFYCFDPNCGAPHSAAKSGLLLPR